MSQSKPKHTTGNNHERGVASPPTTGLPSAGNRTYTVNVREYKNQWAALVDRGANGGIAGRDARVIDHYVPPKYIDLSGIDDHTLRNVELVIAAGVVRTNHGDVLAGDYEPLRTHA